MRTSPAWLLVISSLLAACGPDSTLDPAAGRTEQAFSTAPQEPNHEQVTASGLSFLRPELITALQAANVSTDIELALVSANHFDDCNFSGGSQVLIDSEAEAVAAVDPAVPALVSDPQAIRAFGHALHAAQDFYAHSNWVELGAPGLVDASLSVWPMLSGYSVVGPSGIFIIEGAPPKKTKLTRDATAPYPDSAIVAVKTKDVKSGVGLISGTVDYEPGDNCPASIAMTHAQLNKDQTTNHPAQHAQAMTLATQQTQHEWCRLRALVQSAWGDAGTQRLASWLADPAVTGCP
jgi:hypothetical protein